MSRWFRHYAGMMRDEKLVSVAVRSKQPVERVVWVWGAILESAAEIDDGGRYEFDAAEAAYFLRADEADLVAIVDALANANRLADGVVVKWSDRQYQSDRSVARQAAYRERKRAGKGDVDGEGSVGDGGVTSRDGGVTPQETDTDTERKVLSETSSDPSTPKRKRADYPTDFEDFWRAYPTDQNMSKVETFKAWGKLDETDRKLAFGAVAPFRAWVAKQKDYRVLHAVRFLSQRRFDGFSGATSPAASPVAAPQGFYVTYGTDAGDAWDAHFKTTKGISAPRDARGGWWHKTEWPPEHHSEAA